MKKVLDRLVLRQTPASVPSSSRDVVIASASGKEVFRQNDVSVPETWSDAAAQIIMSRWGRGKMGTDERETSPHQIFKRVASHLTEFGRENGYIHSDEDAAFLLLRLLHLQLTQHTVFNTPVYLNAGWTEKPRCSACFLIAVEDNYASLTEHAVVEGRVFQHGGGAGVSISGVSHEGRALGRGGYASGPLCFNEGWDRSSGAIKSGGSHRRAARDVTMDVRHPDCYRNKEYLETLKHAPLDVDFIREKQIFEEIRRDLASTGRAVGMNTLVDYILPAQNANRAVGVFDDFMCAVQNDESWDVLCPRTKEKVWTYPAKEIWDALCYATWAAADPTVKFLDTINRWNTCTKGKLVVDGKTLVFSDLYIDKANPCNEIMFSVPPIAKTMVACNLAMLRLTKYYNIETDDFHIDEFVADASTMFFYQDLIVDYSDYPTELGVQWTRANRIIGLSFSDLGGLLMLMDLPYDSDLGRDTAGAICALLLASAMTTSADLAEELGACEAWEWNKDHALGVMRGHLDLLQDLCEKLPTHSVGKSVADKAFTLMKDALKRAAVTGFRNMQFVSLAPQGTTNMVADGYSTGPEPVFALQAFKQLSGGGYLVQVPGCVEKLLQHKISQDEKFWREACLESQWFGEDVEHVDATQILEWACHELLNCGGSSFLQSDELKTFETALGVKADGQTKLALSPEAHVDMLASLQRFVSGAISKCVTGDTLLFTEEGVSSIEDLHQDEEADSFRDMSLGLATRDTALELTDSFYYGGVRETRRIRLQDGRELEGTTNHKVLVMSEEGKLSWRPMSQLRVGDFVASRLGANVWASQNTSLPAEVQVAPQAKKYNLPKTMTPEFAELLGMISSDGCVDNRRIRIANNDPAVHSRFRTLVEGLFPGVHVRVREGEIGVRATESCVVSTQISSFFKAIGMESGSPHKVFPWSVLKSTKPCVMAFIKGLSLDSGVTQKHHDEIEFGSVSKTMMRQLHAVLLNAGVRSYFNSKKPTTQTLGDNVLHRVLVRGTEYASYLENTSFVEKRKQRRVEEVAKRIKESTNRVNTGDVIPYVRTSLLSEMSNIPGRSKHSCYTVLCDKRKTHVSRKIASEVYEITGTEIIKEVIENNLFFTPITAIEQGEAEVYDVSVPGSHSFLGNGIINHNTVNLPNSATVEDVSRTYFRAWEKGVKAIAIYRDGSKGAQVITTKSSEEEADVVDNDVKRAALAGLKEVEKRVFGDLDLPTAYRVKLPDAVASIREKIELNGHKIYLHIGLYENGGVGEIYLTGVQGSFVSGMLDSFAVLVSLGLQYGIPFETLYRKFESVEFAPNGFLKGRGFVSSFPSAVMKILKEGIDSGKFERFAEAFYIGSDGDDSEDESPKDDDKFAGVLEEHVPRKTGDPCSNCGSLMVQSGRCKYCISCGASTGGCG